MAQYAEMIDEIDDEKKKMYNIFSYYFDNPVFTKTGVNDHNSIYAVKIRTGLMLDKNYILLIVPFDNSPIGTKARMNTLEWVSLQTRILREDLKTETHNYKQKKEPPFSDKIELVSRDDRHSMYKCDTLKKLEIALLHTDKMQTMYPNSGTLLAALETYKTVVVLK